MQQDYYFLKLFFWIVFLLQIVHTQDDLQDDAVQGEREEDQSDSICVCSSFKVGLKGKVSILLGFILLASFIFVLNLSTLNFMYSPSDHLGKLGRLETLPSLEHQYSCTYIQYTATTIQ